MDAIAWAILIVSLLVGLAVLIVLTKVLWRLFVLFTPSFLIFGSATALGLYIGGPIGGIVLLAGAFGALVIIVPWLDSSIYQSLRDLWKNE